MAKKYVFVRMPSEVYEMFYAKKVRMEKDVREITGKNIPLTMPKVFRLIANHQVEIDMDYLAKFAKARRRG